MKNKYIVVSCYFLFMSMKYYDMMDKSVIKRIYFLGGIYGVMRFYFIKVWYLFFYKFYYFLFFLLGVVC